MRQSLFGFLLTGMIALAVGKTCVWTEHSSLSLFFGTSIITTTVANVEQCKNLCVGQPTCELIEYYVDNGQIVCKLYNYDFIEATLLEYTVIQQGHTLYECTPVEFCSCSLVGDPVLYAFDKSGPNHKVTIYNNGLYNMASANIGPISGHNCDITTTVTTANPDPFHPNRSIVTRLLVEINGQTVELDHTVLIDEIARIKINNQQLTFPVTNPNPNVFVTEHSGSIFVQFTNCPVSLTFSDFKKSKVTITVDATQYGAALTGLCGKCGNNGFSFIGNTDNHLL